MLHDFSAVAQWVTVPTAIALITYSRDATDDAFVQTAIAGGAPRLVTGDDALLSLDPIAGINVRIVTPRHALEEVGGKALPTPKASPNAIDIL